MKKTCVLLIMLMLFGIASVSAEGELETYIKYDMAQQKIAFNGVKENAGYGQVSVIVSPTSVDLKELENKDSVEGENIFFDVVRFEEDKFNGELSLPFNMEVETYNITFYDGAEKQTLVFVYADKDGVSAVANAISGKDFSDTKAVIAQNATALGISAEVLAKCGDDIAEAVHNNYPNGGYDADGLLNQVVAGMVLGMVERGDISLADALKTYYLYLGVECGEKYEKYSADIQAEVKNLLLKLEYKNTAFDKFYDDCLLLARVNKTKDEISLKELMLEEMTELDKSYYSQIKNDYYENLVFKEIQEKGAFYSRNELSAAFLSASQNQLRAKGNANSQFPSAGGGSGGGGGGGGSSNFTSISGEVFSGNNEPATSEGVNSFSDISGHWAQESVMLLASRGIINGFEDKTFRPENAVARSEYSKMICKLFGYETAGLTSEFQDVKETDWFCNYVLSLAEKNIILGYEGKFNPNDTVTRQDAAVIIKRALNSYGIELSDTVTFEDSGEVSDYAAEAVGQLGGAGIIQGYENKFNPHGAITRAQTARIMYNIMQKYMN